MLKFVLAKTGSSDISNSLHVFPSAVAKNKMLIFFYQFKVTIILLTLFSAASVEVKALITPKNNHNLWDKNFKRSTMAGRKCWYNLAIRLPLSSYQ